MRPRVVSKPAAGVVIGLVTGGCLLCPGLPTALAAPADDSSTNVRVVGGTSVPVRVGTAGQVVFGTLTVTAATAAGHTRVYPCAEGLPDASSSNYTVGATVSNFVVAKADANGFACFYSSATAALTWDQTLETTAFGAHRATRLLNTTNDAVTPPANVARKVHVATGRQTVIGNVTVTRTEGSGSLTVYPCADGPPVGSTLNFAAGQTVAAGVVEVTDANGDICLQATAKARVMWDQTVETSTLKTSKAARLLDTRNGKVLAAGSVVKVKLSSGRQTVAGNLTASFTGAAGKPTVYPCSDPRPSTTALAYAAGQTVSGFQLVPTDASGMLCIYTSAPAHLAWDQVMATASPVAHAPVRLLDTTVRADSPAYAFALIRNGVPVRWNPCVAAVRVAVNWGNRGSESANLAAALSRISDATGLPLLLTGTTNVVPRADNGYGALAMRNAEVVIAFSDAGKTDLLTGAQLAAGGFLADPSSPMISRGYVAVDSAQIAKQNPNARVAAYMHELGHVVGLTHQTRDPAQVMFPVLSTANNSGRLGAGDVTGLRRLGLGAGCVTR